MYFVYSIDFNFNEKRNGNTANDKPPEGLTTMLRKVYSFDLWLLN